MSTAGARILGVDFDNTLVSYDTLFHRVARERDLIPDDVAVNKTAVRDYLRKIGREPAWTELQGVVYGSRIDEAESFPGALECLAGCLQAGWQVHIVSHKTRTPILGEPVDLHRAARGWLETHGLFGSGISLPRENAWFELTKAEKIGRIAALGCIAFVDDLPELLSDPAFPVATRRILFRPQEGEAAAPAGIAVAASWHEISRIVTNGA